MNPLWIHLLGLPCLTVVFAQPSSLSQKADSPSSERPHEVQVVPREVTFIEEKTLLSWTGLADRTRVGGATTDVPNSDGSPSGMKMTKASEASPGVPDTTEDAPSAVRLYGFKLLPKERLLARLKCEYHGKVVMKFAPRPTMDAMTAQHRKANMPPRSVRASRIEITNVTEAPYEVVLSLFGQANYAYRLEFERKAK